MLYRYCSGSTLVLAESQSSPFFSLLMFYFYYMADKKDSRYWLLGSVMFSILAQVHYVALLSLAGAGVFFFSIY